MQKPTTRPLRLLVVIRDTLVDEVERCLLLVAPLLVGVRGPVDSIPALTLHLELLVAGTLQDALPQKEICPLLHHEAPNPIVSKAAVLQITFRDTFRV